MTGLRALVEALAEFNITGNISGFLDEGVQGFFSFQRGNQTVTDSLVKTTKVVVCDPGIGVIGFVSELENKHLEFRGIFVRSSLSSLADGFSAFDDIGLAVGHEVLFLESFDEILKRGKGTDTIIGIDVPNLGNAAKSSCCKMSLLAIGNFGKLHVFFDTERPSSDGRNRGVRSVKFIWFRDIH